MSWSTSASVVSFAVCVLLAGCQTPRGEGASGAKLTRAEQSESTVAGESERRGSESVARGSGRAPAMIDGQPVDFETLWPLLAEAQGGEALREIALDRRLAVELERRSIRIGDKEIAAEQALLLESLSGDPQAAARLVVELRRRDGLGPVRFAALVRRNAGLRAVIQDQVTLSPEAIDVAYDVQAGPKRQVRLIAVPTLVEADSVLTQLRGGASFSDLAVDRSTDSSASRGGLLEPFSRHDPSYPESVRVAAFSLTPGGLSAPVLLPQGYVVMTLVREVPASSESLAALRPRLERGVRNTQERLLMDQLSQRLLRESRITVFDESLNSSWTAGGANAP